MMNESKAGKLRSLTIFRDVPEKLLNEIASLANIRQLNAGEVIEYGSGPTSKICFILSGKVKIIDLDVENELIKDVLSEGELFGDLGLEGNPRSFEYAQALTEDTVVCYIKAAYFSSVLELDPGIAVTYAKVISKKFQRLEDRYADLMQNDVRSRLVRFISNWARIEGSVLEDKIILKNYLTHNDIAGIISTSRQTVTILFNELKNSGLLQYNRRLIQLNDWKKWDLQKG